MGHAEGYVLPKETIFEKIQETLDLGGTGVLMQGGLHPDLKIEWYEDLFRGIKERFPIHLHCLSAPEVANVAEVSGLDLRETIRRLMAAGSIPFPAAGRRSWMTPCANASAASSARLRNGSTCTAPRTSSACAPRPP